MLSVNLFVIYLFCFTFEMTGARTPPVLSKEALELKVLLRAAINRNHQLQVQNQRLKLIWSGLDKMCSAITSSGSCQCEGPQQSISPILETAHINQRIKSALLRHRMSKAKAQAAKTKKKIPKAVQKEHKAKRHRDIPPPAVEFYKHANGNFVNSANNKKLKVGIYGGQPRDKNTKIEKKTAKVTEPMYTVSPSPIAAILMDLNLAHFVANLRGQKPTSTTKPVVDHFDHHAGVDIMHEMLKPRTHKTTAGGKPAILDNPFEALEQLSSLGGPSSIATEKHIKHDQHAIHKAHKATTTSKPVHKHHPMPPYEQINEVSGKPSQADKGLNLENHMLHTDYAGSMQGALDQTGTKLSFDLINKMNGHLLKHGNKIDPMASEMALTPQKHKHNQHFEALTSSLPDKIQDTPQPVDNLQHHTGNDIIHELLGPHNHKSGDNTSAINYVDHNHQATNNDLSAKLILNDLLIATEQSIQEKQLAEKNKTAPSVSNIPERDPNAPLMPSDPGTVEKFIFGNDPNPLEALDLIPKQNEKVDIKPELPKVTARGLTVTLPPKYVKLAIKSVSSEGLVLNAISVTVRYTAPFDHTTEWLQLQENGATTRTSGVRSQSIGDPDSEYSSNMVFVEANSTRHALFRLFGNDKSISLQFDLAELRLSGEQLLPDFMDDILEYNETIMAPRNQDLEINLKVRGSPSGNPGLRNTEIFFTGLNTTTEPNTVFEIVHFNSEGVSVVLTPKTQNTSTMKITIKRPYIDYGGILTVRLAQTVGGYLEGYYYGHLIRVLEFFTREVIPFGNLGVYYLPKTTLVRDPSQSILCAAMGNPPPEVVILKLAPDGTEKETLAETIMLDTVTNMKSLTLYADKPDTSEGNYICRASIGAEIIDSKTEVIVVQPPVFDELTTGVTRNASDVVTISCKASGRPRPALEMRLYEEHGPNLAKPGIYKTSILTPNNTTSQLTLTLSQNNREIHTVVCVAKQNVLGSKEHYKKIIVFPKSDDYTNWYLYNRLRSMNTGW